MVVVNIVSTLNMLTWKGSALPDYRHMVTHCSQKRDALGKVYLILSQRLLHWPNIKINLGKRLLAGVLSSSYMVFFRTQTAIRPYISANSSKSILSQYAVRYQQIVVFGYCFLPLHGSVLALWHLLTDWTISLRSFHAFSFIRSTILLLASASGASVALRRRLFPRGFTTDSLPVPGCQYGQIWQF